MEGDDRIEAVAELRTEHALDGRLGFGLAVARAAFRESDRRRAHLARSGIRRHNQHGVAEVGLPARVIGQRRVVHHLQQDVVDVGMRFLDLVEQHDAVGMRAHGVDEQPALLEADISRRGADQPRHSVLLHVLAHVEADELVAEQQRELLGELRLADAGRTGEQKRSGRPLGLAEAGARPLDRLRDELHGVRLAEDDAVQRFLERAQPIAIGRGRLPRRDARRARRHRLDIHDVDNRHHALGGFQPRHRARLVDQIDRAVGQAIVPQVPRGELRGRLERRIGIRHGVMRFVTPTEPRQDAHRLVDRRLVDRDLLQAPREGAILLDVLELLERRRTDDAQFASREERLHHRREIHRAAGHRARADGRVNLVDEENRLGPARERPDHRLEALLEIAAEARAGEERAGVEREDLGALQFLLHVVAEQARREPLGHRRFADARFADEHRVILAAAAEDFDRALQLLRAADQRIEQPLPRAIGEVDAVRRQRIARGRRLLVACAGARARVPIGVAVVRRRRLRHAVRDVLEDVEPRDPVLGEQPRGVRLRLLHDRGEDVARVRFLALRRLHVQDRRLQHLAERGGLLGLVAAAARHALDRRLEIRAQVAAQLVEIGAARREDPLAVRIVRQDVEQMLEREKGVAARHRFAQRDMKDDGDGGREHGTGTLRFFDGRLQRIAGVAGDGGDAIGFGFRDLPRVDAGNPASVQVHLHHDAVRLRGRFLEQRLEHVDDEHHGRVVVVQQDDVVERRLLLLRLRSLLLLDAAVACRHVALSACRARLSASPGQILDLIQDQIQDRILDH